MIKFSVKKPLTIFVAAIAVVLVGVIAYLRMTPDLMPNMDFPYVMIMTTYPGASPEVVEEEVSKPLEASMATLEHIDQVMSVSSENYSMVTLVFQDGTDLDTVTLDIQQNISLLQAGWNDMVGTPYVLKINPSMLPVAMIAISREGMDIIELSEFVEDTLQPQLEGVDGIARISATGLVENQIHVVIDQDKIDLLNAAILEAVEGKLDDAQSELDSALAQLNAGRSQLEAAQTELANQTSQAQGQMNAQQMELLQTEIELRSQLSELNSAKTQLQTLLTLMETARSALSDLQTRLAETEAQLPALEALQTQVNEADAAMAAAIAAGLGPDDEQYQQAAAAVQAAEDALAAAGLNRVTLPPAIETLRQAESVIRSSIAELEQTLAENGITVEELDARIAETRDGIAQIDSGIAQIQDAITQIQNGTMQISDGMTLLSQMQTTGILTIAQNTAALTAALTQIELGQAQLDGSRDAALDQADISGTVTIQMVAQILSAQNFNMPAGYVEEDGLRYMVSVGDKIEDLDEMQDLLLFDTGLEGVGEVHLSDVAEVFVTDNSEDSYAILNGYDGIVLSFEKQSNAATATVCDSLEARLTALEEEYPGLQFVALMNQGDYIHLIINAIMSSLLFGALFAIIVLFLFLRDLRPTVITVVAIPISLLFALALMYFSGMTLNMISLAGLAVAVGMLVDNSIVVIENIYRLRSKGATVAQAAATGTKQVAGAVAASTLTTICVFVPIVFTHGTTRELFQDLGLTLGFSLAASLIISLTLVPAMAVKLLKSEKPFEKKRGRKEGVVYRTYRKASAWSLNHKKIVLPGAMALVVLTAGLALLRGFSFLPNVDTEQLTLTITMPEETTREEAIGWAEQVMDYVSNEIPEAQDIGAMMGSSVSYQSFSGSSATAGSYDVTMYVELEEGTSGAAVGRDIIRAMEDLPCEITADSSSGLNMGSYFGSGISLNVYSDDMEEMQQAARDIAERIAQVDGVTSADNGLQDAETAIHVTVNKDEAMRKGYTVAQVYMQIADALSGSVTAMDLNIDEQTADVLVENADGVSPDDLRAMEFAWTDPDGEEQTVRLDQIATIRETTSLTSINREDQERYVQVTAQIEDGRNITKMTAAVQEAVAGMNLPDSVRYDFGGENEEIMTSVRQLGLMLVLGVVLVYFVMVAQFQSLKSPFIIMFTIPLAFTGGFLALLIAGFDVSIISLIGFVMLTGVIVNNGIVLVDYTNQLRAAGMERRAALTQAGVTRMRPIFMTTLTTVLGLIVMAAGGNIGTKLIQPMALVCIGGLLYGTVMTLFVVPCIYDIMNRKPIVVLSDEDLYFEDDPNDVSDEIPEEVVEEASSDNAGEHAEEAPAEEAPEAEETAAEEAPGTGSEDLLEENDNGSQNQTLPDGETVIESDTGDTPEE
ncbi:MAG: efflux RND transporter permease subunit [Lachnospiraceae bacterium]|nr:efflux RND transporter permease subunit [Lachnospiraceae bacterium]